ncbi:hypothetical protein BLNAU_9904 [Blattamonas nauphoetae]|uniref:Uncharacterized protein n=1 Tax=Blattamonas nauphoetae TaxID=2049346 RepID=A0ABQ9XUM6_9EUKA|nr:hypothetical protein BLNAU_9904 [Blattamonas nauphoetae]
MLDLDYSVHQIPFSFQTTSLRSDSFSNSDSPKFSFPHKLPDFYDDYFDDLSRGLQHDSFIFPQTVVDPLITAPSSMSHEQPDCNSPPSYSFFSQNSSAATSDPHFGAKPNLQSPRLNESMTFTGGILPSSTHSEHNHHVREQQNGPPIISDKGQPLQSNSSLSLRTKKLSITAFPLNPSKQAQQTNSAGTTTQISPNPTASTPESVKPSHHIMQKFVEQLHTPILSSNSREHYLPKRQLHQPPPPVTFTVPKLASLPHHLVQTSDSADFSHRSEIISGNTRDIQTQPDLLTVSNHISYSMKDANPRNVSIPSHLPVVFTESTSGLKFNGLPPGFESDTAASATPDKVKYVIGPSAPCIASVKSGKVSSTPIVWPNTSKDKIASLKKIELNPSLELTNDKDSEAHPISPSKTIVPNPAFPVLLPINPLASQSTIPSNIDFQPAPPPLFLDPPTHKGIPIKKTENVKKEDEMDAVPKEQAFYEGVGGEVDSGKEKEPAVLEEKADVETKMSENEEHKEGGSENERDGKENNPNTSPILPLPSPNVCQLPSSLQTPDAGKARCMSRRKMGKAILLPLSESTLKANAMTVEQFLEVPKKTCKMKGKSGKGVGENEGVWRLPPLIFDSPTRAGPVTVQDSSDSSLVQDKSGSNRNNSGMVSTLPVLSVEKREKRMGGKNVSLESILNSIPKHLHSLVLSKSAHLLSRYSSLLASLPNPRWFQGQFKDTLSLFRKTAWIICDGFPDNVFCDLKRVPVSQIPVCVGGAVVEFQIELNERHQSFFAAVNPIILSIPDNFRDVEESDDDSSSF